MFQPFCRANANRRSQGRRSASCDASTASLFAGEYSRTELRTAAWPIFETLSDVAASQDGDGARVSNETRGESACRCINTHGLSLRAVSAEHAPPQTAQRESATRSSLNSPVRRASFIRFCVRPPTIPRRPLRRNRYIVPGWASVIVNAESDMGVSDDTHLP